MTATRKLQSTNSLSTAAGASIAACTAVAALAAGAPQAEAVVLTQTVGPVAYSTTDVTANTTPLVFAPFTAGLASELTGVKIGSSTTGTYSGSVSLIGFSNPQSFAVNAATTFTFGLGSSYNLSGTASPVTLTPSSTTGTPPVVTTSTISGTYPTSNYGSLAIATAAERTYFTGAPTISSYATAYTATTTPTGGAVGYANATFGGNLYLTYEYTVPDPVPAPSAIVGAGAAFAYMKRLRSHSTRLRRSVG